MPYRSVPFAVATVLCLLLAAPSLALAQEPALRGRVVDAYGAAVPDALVTVKRAGRAPVTTTTDDAGTFSVPSLGPGSTFEARSARLRQRSAIRPRTTTTRSMRPA